MKSQELYLGDATSANVWRCLKCHNIFTERSDADKCCTMNYKNKPMDSFIDFNKLTKYVAEEIQKTGHDFIGHPLSKQDKHWLARVGDKYVSWVADNLKECSKKHLTINDNIL